MINPRQQLHNLWQRGRQFLQTEVAILGGAMTWVSERHLVSAISNAGGFGVVACGSMTPELLKAEIQATRALTSKPFGVNLITIHPQLFELIEICQIEQVSHVVLAGGLPPADAIQKLKSACIKVLCFAPAFAIAKKLVRSGVDAIIIEGHEAGGHIGPVSTSVLAQEILPHVPEVPIFVAGGIGRGEAIVSYLEMGASGCQLGTRFVCSLECQAHPNFKKAFIRAAARNAVVSPQLDQRFPVIPVRAIENKGMQEFISFQRQMIEQVDAGLVSLTDAQLKVEHYWAGALRRAVVDGDVEHGSLMAGQSIGMVDKEESVQEIINALQRQAFQVLEERVTPQNQINHSAA
jgi:enoyl-[acyl-carrier protein] reductase II